MLKTSALINDNKNSFLDWEYYLPLLSKARRNVRKHPDICIEICKSTLEGVSKSIILGLDSSATKAEIDKKDVDQVVKLAVKALKANDDVVEDNFVTRATSLANALGALRNVRSDISHGREVPKPESSSEEFGRLCMQMTDAIASYMLRAFFEAKARALPSLPSQSEAFMGHEPKLEPTGEITQIGYDVNPDFNEWLDQDNPLPGKMLYSEALHRLYYEDYFIELIDYRDAVALSEIEAVAEIVDDAT